MARRLLLDQAEVVMSKAKRILVPVDLSEGSARALAAAREYGAADAELHVVLVVQQDGADEDKLVELQQAVEAFAGEHGAPNTRSDVRTTLGNEAIEVARHAEAIGADLVVVASHGRTGLARVNVGSVAERIVRYCACPVLVIKTPPA